LVGLRFGNITIPKGSFITRAYIQFTVDATNKNTDPCEVTIRAENSDNPVTYNTADTFNLTKRPKIADSVKWNVSPLVIGLQWAVQMITKKLLISNCLFSHL